METQREELSLKWGTLKSYRVLTDKTREALERYEKFESTSGMIGRETDESAAALCAVIDVMDIDTVYLAWDGKDVSKEEAKKYVMDYPR